MVMLTKIITVVGMNNIIVHNVYNIIRMIMFNVCNTGVKILQGNKLVNGGAGYGLEIPCVYQFYGQKA